MRFEKVGVLMGGCSSEREISLTSGRAVVEGLREARLEGEAPLVRLAVEVEDLVMVLVAVLVADEAEALVLAEALAPEHLEVQGARAEALARTGLVLQSPLGDATLAAPPTVLAEDLREPFDVVLVSCKAYDLDGAVAAFAPVTDLAALSEFAALTDNPLVRRLALTHGTEALAGRAAWIIIGDADARVGTDKVVAFAHALAAASPAGNVTLRVAPVPGHHSLPQWHVEAAEWFRKTAPFEE